MIGTGPCKGELVPPWETRNAGDNKRTAALTPWFASRTPGRAGDMALLQTKFGGTSEGSDGDTVPRGLPARSPGIPACGALLKREGDAGLSCPMDAVPCAPRGEKDLNIAGSNVTLLAWPMPGGGEDDLHKLLRSVSMGALSCVKDIDPRSGDITRDLGSALTSLKGALANRVSDCGLYI